MQKNKVEVIQCELLPFGNCSMHTTYAVQHQIDMSVFYTSSQLENLVQRKYSQTKTNEYKINEFVRHIRDWLEFLNRVG